MQPKTAFLKRLQIQFLRILSSFVKAIIRLPILLHVLLRHNSKSGNVINGINSGREVFGKTRQSFHFHD